MGLPAFYLPGQPVGRTNQTLYEALDEHRWRDLTGRFDEGDRVLDLRDRFGRNDKSTGVFTVCQTPVVCDEQDLLRLARALQRVEATETLLNFPQVRLCAQISALLGDGGPIPADPPPAVTPSRPSVPPVSSPPAVAAPAVFDPAAHGAFCEGCLQDGDRREGRHAWYLDDDGGEMLLCDDCAHGDDTVTVLERLA